MAHGGEDDICAVAVLAFEMAAAEVAIALHVSDDGFDRRATPQFALDNAEDAALLTRDEDAMRSMPEIFSVMHMRSRATRTSVAATYSRVWRLTARTVVSSTASAVKR
jgi:hypothetical protein